MTINLKMTLEINNDALDDIKKLEHHIEHILDLDNWPEIKSISNVKITIEN